MLLVQLEVDNLQGSTSLSLAVARAGDGHPIQKAPRRLLTLGNIIPRWRIEAITSNSLVVISLEF